MERVALACDIGTSSLKAALVDSSGRVLASARVRFPEARRNAVDWIVAFADAIHSIRKSLKQSGRAFAPDAVSISGNGPTLVAVEKDGSAGPVLLWNEPLPARLADSSRSGDGAAPTTDSIFIPRIAGYRDLFAPHFEAALHLLSGPEFLVWALTGNAVTILPEPRFVRAYWTDEDLAQAGLSLTPLTPLPPFVPIGTVCGRASAAGLSRYLAGGSATRSALEAIAGIPVIAGGPDFIAALVGTDTLSAGKACDRAGTSEGLNVCVEHAPSAPAIRVLPAVTAGLWNAAYLLPDTGAAFHAWRIGSKNPGRPYSEIMAEIEASPIVAQAGEAPHSGRAMVERIGFAVRRGVEALSAATGIHAEYALSGGQARNDAWNQMKADITGATFTLTATPDGELMGDAAIAFAALGEYGSVAEAASAMVTVARRFEPNGARHRLYTEKYLTHENP